jgi:serine/threonine-protein kinase RsbW
MGGSETSVCIPSDLSAIEPVIQSILNELQKNNYSHDAIFATHLAVEEALANAIKHGNKKDPDKQVFIRFQVDGERAFIAVRDEGEGFKPDDVPDPTADENIEKTSGRGIMLMRTYMSEVSFSQQGDEVRMVKVNEP